MIINTEGLSDAQKDSEKFKTAYADMLAQLTRPGFIPVLCAHEAAHLIYFQIIGMKDYKTLPPRITYDSEIDDYTGHLAAIEFLGVSSWESDNFEDWFFKMAVAHAAGGVVARKLLQSSEGGDQDDRAEFDTLCTEINKDPAMSINPERVWKDAQSIVAEQLENSEVMGLIHQEAIRLRPLLGL